MSEKAMFYLNDRQEFADPDEPFIDLITRLAGNWTAIEITGSSRGLEVKATPLVEPPADPLAELSEQEGMDLFVDRVRCQP